MVSSLFLLRAKPTTAIPKWLKGEFRFTLGRRPQPCDIDSPAPTMKSLGIYMLRQLALPLSRDDEIPRSRRQSSESLPFPEGVLKDSTLSKTQKRKILMSGKAEAIHLKESEAEGFRGGEHCHLDDIKCALDELDQRPLLTAASTGSRSRETAFEICIYIEWRMLVPLCE